MAATARARRGTARRSRRPRRSRRRPCSCPSERTVTAAAACFCAAVGTFVAVTPALASGAASSWWTSTGPSVAATAGRLSRARLRIGAVVRPTRRQLAASWSSAFLDASTTTARAHLLQRSGARGYWRLPASVAAAVPPAVALLVVALFSPTDDCGTAHLFSNGRPLNLPFLSACAFYGCVART